MDNDEFESRQRAGEWFHSLTIPPGVRTIVRVDGRSFSRFTEERFEKPFDPRFSALMEQTARALLTEFDARYAYTESDEISILFDPSFALFGRSLEKLVSLTAGVASATFSLAAGEAAHFDSRVWIGAGVEDVVDYFSWRQADASRCALNGWCYWTLRTEGKTRAEATGELEHSTFSDRNELLFRRGINFAELPAWQRRGVGLWRENRAVRVERELPMKAAYRALIGELAQPMASGSNRTS
ncbi:tRNA(His) guanylyltransferase Thg1 family protein [Amycolatopsis sp. H20-H5]|uniref:tRNA(His) guanylyltransferase Thg1 family protein n=1 Tax=Amycolatopsis sp. H20-H5 TaxID=3046309 RepID=UPI002DBCABAC|nr:tRNA(His) guanylyltransferase Thg1 family protein [Amycolatopsis sp. H20-H5]MEC3981138.1 tRNA(His) guanylyltransferase Thg1 family protein [Amycolatopsis sp. H20-H5]